MVRSSSSLANLLRQQALYLSVALICGGIFWAIGQSINLGTVVVYSISIGNLTTPPMSHVRRMSKGLPLSSRTLIFLGALLLTTPVVYLVSTVIVYLLAPPSPQALRHLLLTGWKFPCLVIFVYSLLSFLYVEARQRLERRNTELERSVEFSAAQLEMQEHEMERAREIQESLLPKDIPQIAGFEVATSWQPARMVGGDYFDVLKLGDNRLAICIADVVGKGVSAALLMANMQATVRAFARESESPARVCSRVNSVLCGNIATGKFVTLFYGILDTAERTIQYCNAGHTSPILLSENSTRQLSADGAALGLFPAWIFEDRTIELSPGDKLLLFTDGITEAPGANGEELGDEELISIAKANRSLSASALNRAVMEDVTRYCGGHFEDDATLLVVATH